MNTKMEIVGMARENRAKREAKRYQKELKTKRLQDARRAERLGLSHELLIDRLINDEWGIRASFKTGYSPNEREIDRLQFEIQCAKRFLSESHVVRATNVLNYWDDHKSRSTNLNPKMFPGCVPPFDNMWIEFGPSSSKRLYETKRFGVMVRFVDRNDELKILESDGFVVNQIVQMTLFLDHKIQRKAVPFPLLFACYAIDERGETNGSIAIKTFHGTNSVVYDCDNPEEAASRFAVEFLRSAMLTLSFMNCSKGVAVSKVEPPTEFDEARAKSQRKPFVKYSRIDIGGIKEVLRTEGGIESNGIGKALHICRGHFATYNDTFMGRKLSAPMTFWVPSHVRGSSKHGVVVSDYNVSPPIQEAAQ